MMDAVELANRFIYHALREDQSKRYGRIRSEAHKFAVLIDDLCPDSREKSLAITHLEDVVYCANASIARHE